MTRQHFDPIAIPVESVAGESALPAERFGADWLRARFSESPRWEPESTNEHLMCTSIEPPTPAAVLVPIVMRAERPTLLLTQRTAHLTDHAGQVSFPGGRTEEIDATAIDAALLDYKRRIRADFRFLVPDPSLGCAAFRFGG